MTIVVERCLTARAATPSGLSRFASSCLHRITIAWRRWFPLGCSHQWEDGWAFANCVEVTIPTGERRAVSWQVRQFCTNCEASRRRQLSKAEWVAWKPDLLAAFDEDDGHVWVDDLASVGEAGTATTTQIGVVHEHAVPKGDAHD